MKYDNISGYVRMRKSTTSEPVVCDNRNSVYRGPQIEVELKNVFLLFRKFKTTSLPQPIHRICRSGLGHSKSHSRIKLPPLV